MLQYLLPIFVVVILVAVSRSVARQCHEAPERRRWFLLGSIAALIVAGLLVPWVFADLKPPWSESPSGIFIHLGKALVAGSFGLLGLGALIGALLPQKR